MNALIPLNLVNMVEGSEEEDKSKLGFLLLLLLLHFWCIFAHIYIHTYIQTYIHTYIHTSMQETMEGEEDMVVMVISSKQGIGVVLSK